ncbi:MAG TPA: TrkA family potassium uptake protein [Actinomycetes bacterium]|nr:TrkA family potassium uptake protein [Actinomycetes bacterium]
MHVVIMGCGRVGSTLATELDGKGHEVVVIDRNPDAFRRLGEGFGGSTVTGVGFDWDTLLEAGLEKTDAFVAVSSGDNSNIVSARVARENFGINTVVARIYDPRRAEIYQRLGIPTVATVRWTADRILRRLLPGGVHEDYRDPSGAVMMAELPVASDWVGQTYQRLEQECGIRIGYITRFGHGQLTTASTVVQEGDIVHALLSTQDAERAAAAVARAPEGV